MKFVLMLVLLLSTGLVAASSKQPNIVFFLGDDLGLMDTSVPMLTDGAGNPTPLPRNLWYRTPNLERLAARGIRFSQFNAHTVCSPTRVSIMTGLRITRRLSRA